MHWVFQEKKADRNFLAIGLTCFLLLLVFSFIFYKERIAFLDNAYQLFLLIQDGRIETMAGRWPDTIIRFLPFLGLKMGLSLKWLMILFSISYPLTQFMIYLLTYMVEKSRIWSTMILCFLILGTTESFYWCSSELIHVICWAMLLLALIENHSLKASIKWTAISAVSMLCIFLHPLIVVPIAFVLFYEFLWNRSIERGNLLFLVCFVASWLLKSMVFRNWYDDYKSAEFVNNLNKYFDHLWAIPSNISFGTELIYKYQILVFLGTLLFVLLVYKRRILELLFIIVSVVGYVLIVHIGNPEAGNSFYREVSYLPLTIMLVFPLLLMPELRQRSNLVLVILSLCLLISFIRIGIGHSDYKDRLDWITHQRDNEDCTKWIIDENKLDMDLIKMSWSMPFESLITSSAFQDQSKTIIATDERTLQNSNDIPLFLNPFKEIPISSLNSKYFKLNNSTYCILK